MSDEFYVGYRAQAPGGLAHWLRFRVALLLIGAIVLGAAVTAAQSPFTSAVFEFGEVRAFRGVLRRLPYPVLEVARPTPAAGGLGDVSPVSRYLLSGSGKFGVDEEVAAELDGQAVRLKGTLVYRGDRTLIEVAEGSLRRDDDPRAAPPRLDRPPEELGRFTLRGEIVDSKCFLGVMKPGNLKPHRACAVRCISGGVPPVFLVRDAAGAATYLLLTAEDGSAVNEHVLDRVAEPLEITGDVVRHGDLLVLQADPATYRRLD